MKRALKNCDIKEHDCTKQVPFVANKTDNIKQMKNYIFKSIFILALLFLFSCEEYLDKAPESTLTVEEVFKDFDHAQGFIEEMYAFVVDYGTGGHWQTDYMYGDDAIVNNTWMPSAQIDKGNLGFWRNNNFTYLVVGVNRTGNAFDSQPFNRPGVWDGGLMGIRKANNAIKNIDLMVNATQEEKDVILGQAYFFRAFFHYEIMKFWGRFPYIKEVLTDEYQLPRPSTYKECALEANEDFKKAAKLLPVNWDTKSYGQKTLNENKGRLTKGAAYAFQGKNLLLAASPLMKGSTDTYDYDTELAAMAVDAFAEVLKLVDQGVYALVPFDKYEDVFWQSGKKVWPGSTEFIFNGMGGDYGRTKGFADISLDNKVTGGSAVLLSPTHNFIYYNFGMANGLSIEDDLSGAYGIPTYDPTKPFKNRDPRFYKWITVDGDVLSDKPAAGQNKTAQLFTNGLHRSSGTGSMTGYFYKKFLPTLYSKWNQGPVNNNTPWRIRMRLTDVYLMYAEALHAAKKSANTAPGSYNLTAEQVVNIMRDRAGVPHVPSSIVSNPNKFMDELRRERSVELSFEAHRWVDIRRWVLADKLKYRMKTGLDFPKNHSYFQEFELITRVCDYPKHFWMPFEANQTQFYKGFDQNPGW